MKAILKDFEKVFSYYFISLYGGFFGAILFNIPIKFIVNINNKLLSFLLGIVFMVISLCILFYRKGYKENNFKLGKTIISIFSLLFVLLAVLLFFYLCIRSEFIYFSGPTDYLATYLFDIYNLNFVYIRYGDLALMLIAFIFIYSPIMIFGQYLGAKIHNKRFENLINNKKPD